MATKIKTKPDHFYQVCKAQQWSNLQTTGDPDDLTVSGTVRSPHGIAICESSHYRVGSKGNYRYNEYTSVRFIYNGKEHSLYEERFRTERSLASLAYTFIKAIANGERL